MSHDETGALGARSARLYFRYARAIDENDLKTARAIVTDDVQVTRGNLPTLRGVDAFLDIFQEHRALAVPVCKHVITNVLAERVGEEIETHAYFQADFFDEGRTRVIVGSYEDIHVEDGGELKIAHKRIRVERVLHLPAADAWPHRAR